MKLQKYFQMALNFLLVILFISACSPPRSKFYSDEQMKNNLTKYKTELVPLIGKCRSEKESQGFKRHIRESFRICKKVDQKKLQNLNIQELATEFKGSRVLFIMNHYIDDRVDTFVEEKGYMFSDVPIKNNLIKEGSLDQFVGKEMFVRRGSKEVWKYKQIEPNWYIYYRQYFYPYLG